MDEGFKAGFVNIFGAPNAGKSTLLNALLGEQLVITSPKVQTTRHRILGILNDNNYQIVFSDTPGIILDTKYKLHQKMMLQLKSALEDADVAILMHDVTQPIEDFEEIASSLSLKVPVLLLLNKTDLLGEKDDVKKNVKAYTAKYPKWDVQPVSAKTKAGIQKIVPVLLKYLPEGFPFYPDDNMSDRPVRFFASELIRQQIYELYHEEIPYHTAVLIETYEDKPHITVIKATIVVSRETQKVIVIGKKGSKIKELGIAARKAIEEFIGNKVHLELFVKVRPKWRDNENYLKEYGYNP